MRRAERQSASQSALDFKSPLRQFGGSDGSPQGMRKGTGTARRFDASPKPWLPPQL